jgi:hypothetical protein
MRHHAILNFCNWPRKIITTAAASCLFGITANEVYLLAVLLAGGSLLELSLAPARFSTASPPHW